MDFFCCVGVGSIIVIFFFSSRRRHTRLQGDWSSDVCSSDLAHLPSSSMTQTGDTLGSPKYMSPEQVLGLAADPRADLFSLGIVLFELLTGRHPFVQANDTAFSLMHRIAGAPHAPLREIDPAIPPGFDRIVERALAKKPEQRYQRAAEMASDLRNYRGIASPDT